MVKVGSRAPAPTVEVQQFQGEQLHVAWNTSSCVALTDSALLLVSPPLTIAALRHGWTHRSQSITHSRL